MADENELNQQEIEKLLAQSAADTPQEGTKPAADDPGDSGVELDQAEIEALIGAASAASNPPKASQPPQAQDPPPSQPQPAAPAAGGGEGIAAGDIEYLLNQAQEALDSIDSAPDEPPSGTAAYKLEEFSGMSASTETATLDLIRDVELDVKIELGRTHMYLEDVLRLRRGSVVPLDKMAGDPVDIYVNGRLIARGEVLVLNDNFCVRVGELLAGSGAA